MGSIKDRKKTLKREAAASARYRGHRNLKWIGPIGTCLACSAWVRIDPEPAPNDIEIGGSAVGLNCTRA